MGYRYRITAPTQATTRVLGVPFKLGIGELDIRTRRAALEYFRRRPEYQVEELPDPEPEPTPEPSGDGQTEDAGPDLVTGDPPTGTVAEVLEWVHADSDMDMVVARARNALAVEQARDKPRSTLVEELEALQRVEPGD